MKIGKMKEKEKKIAGKYCILIKKKEMEKEIKK